MFTKKQVSHTRVAYEFIKTHQKQFSTQTMWSKLTVASAVPSLLVIIGAATVLAQQPPQVLAGREIAKARRSNDAGSVMRILAQTDSKYSASTLEALADSLVTLVVEGRSSSSAAQNLRSSARGALAVAGSIHAKVPYAGAGSRLFKIAQGAPDAGDRAAAIAGIAELANSSEALVLLQKIATSDNPAALHAVRNLWDMMPKKGGLDVLRELVRSNAVTEPRARRELDRVAVKFGWKQAPR